MEFRVTVYHPNTSRSHSFVELKFTDNVNSWIDNMPSELIYGAELYLEDVFDENDMLLEVYDIMDDAITDLEIKVVNEGPHTRRLKKMHSYLLGFIEKVAFRSYGEHETQQDALETCLSFTDDFVDRLALKAEERGEFLYESIILLYRESHRQDLIQTIQSYYSRFKMVKSKA